MRDCAETISPVESARPFAYDRIGEALKGRLRSDLNPSFDEVGTPASCAHWIVLDLETTGLGPTAQITEIGAVRVRGTDTTDEFSSLVQPTCPIPPFITQLTGITPSMVKDADPIECVLERFIEWAGLEEPSPPVLVAHNAPFDMGFLRRAARVSQRPWPALRTVDTLALARLALPRPIVPNHKLATIASYFGTATRPEHRALGDARATADILLGFITMLSQAGADDVEDLIALSEHNASSHRHRPSFVSDLPTCPGVYHFIDTQGATLYVGSATSLRARVGSYYTSAEKRSTIQRMLKAASGVRPYPTSCLLEARIRELRDIAQISPPYNRASKCQARQYWVVGEDTRVRVTTSISLHDLSHALGPFGTRSHAARAANAITYVAASTTACELPTLIGEAVAGSSTAVAHALTTTMARLSAQGRFEAAASTRDNLSAYMTGVERATMHPVLAASRIVWARATDSGCALHVASYGRLLASQLVPSDADPEPWIDTLRATGPMRAPERAAHAASWAESSLICTDLSHEDTRLIEWEGPVAWAQPLMSPLREERLRDLLDHATAHHRSNASA